MAKTYIDSVGGELQQKVAIDTSAGAADAAKLIATDAAGKLPVSMLPNGVELQVKNMPSFENLAAHDLVHVYNDAGTVKARKADASNALPANGYALSAVTAPAAVDVYFSGIIAGFVGLTPAARYFLSDTAGGVTTTPPTTSGHIVQFVGTAVSTTEIDFTPVDYIRLA